MTDLNEYIYRLTNLSDLYTIISKSENNPPKCNQSNNDQHTSCVSLDEENRPSVQCPQALVYLIIKIICLKPSLVDEECRKLITKYYQTNAIKASGLISLKNLTTLQETKSPLLTWLKYETLLIQLIKEGVYEPKILAGEVLVLVKEEMDPQISVKFCSVLGACVKHCRNISNLEDEEEKWSEIIDWMSWFLAVEEEDFT